MRRRFFCLSLCALGVLGARPATAVAGSSALYKGEFTFRVISKAQGPGKNHVTVRGSLEGVETLLGRFTGEVRYLVDLKTEKFTGTVTKTASNGDRLHENVHGQFTETGSVGTFRITGGTGRFAGASGGGDFTGVWTAADLSTAQITFATTLSRPHAGRFQALGTVGFTNVVAGIQVGGVVPYLGHATSALIGQNTQTGTIVNLTGLMPIDATTLVFEGEVGPHPTLPGHPKVHVIDTKDGQIHCTWTAVFTLQVIDPTTGAAIFSGDGSFTVIGGTGKYHGATGTFTTLFQSDPVAHGADTATAHVQQFGSVVSRRR